MTKASDNTEKTAAKTPSRRSILKAVSGAGAVALAGCSGDGGSGSGGSGGGTKTKTKSGDGNKSDTITIGLTRSTTGSFVFDSRKGFRGLKLWQRRTNEAGGLKVNGKKRKVKLKSYDDRSSKQRVVRLYETLITEDNVDVLFAPFSSTLTKVAAAVASKHNKFLMAWGAASTSIYKQGYNNLVSVETPTKLIPNGQLPAMAEAGAKTIATLYLDAEFPASLADALKENASKFGMELIHSESYSSGTSDFTSTLKQIKNKDPDVFYPINYVGDNVTMVRQMKSNGIIFPWSQFVYATNPQFYDSLGKDAKYMYGWHNIHPKVNKNTNRGLTVPDFFDQYRKTFGGNWPSFNSANGYSAALMIGECMQKASSVRDTDALVKAAKSLSGNVTTVNGKFSIHPEYHYQDHSHYFATQNQHTGGQSAYDKFEVMGPKDIASPTAEPIYPIPGWDER